MISIIICSREANISDGLRGNINSTIGVDYELVVIDNSLGKYSIFQAYNEGLNRAMHPYLCFMHDDVYYHTINWGQKVIDHLQKKNVGMIGVLGGHYLSKRYPHFWSSSVMSGNFLYKNGDSIVRAGNDKYIQDENFVDVVACDGLWLCFPKSLFSNIRFDDITYDGFDLYDMDISLQVLTAGFSVRVINDILIEHRNHSMITKKFHENQLLFLQKWDSYLPVIKGLDFDQTCAILIEDVRNLTNSCDMLQLQNDSILQSEAYRIGRFFVSPFSFLMNKLVNIRF